MHSGGRFFSTFKSDFINEFDGFEVVHEPPLRCFRLKDCLQIVARLNQQYDLVAGLFPPQMIEAIRTYKASNFKKMEVKFAKWVMPAENERLKEIRWCVVG